MKKYTILGDLITPAKVVRCGKGNYPVLSMTMHDGIVLQSDRFKKSLASADQSDYKVVEYGKLVIGFPIDEGVLYIQKVAPEGIMSPAYSTWDVDTTRINPDFLELCLHSPQSMQYYKDKLRSTTARRRSIPTADLLALRIRTPDMESQFEAVAVARKVDEMIAIRHAQATLLDQLVKSRFIELFGAITETVPLSYYIEALNAGKSLAGEEECPNKVLKTGATTYDYFDATQVKNLPDDYEPLEDHRIKTGDVIISRMNTAELVGAAAYVWEAPERTYLPDRLWKAEIKETACPIFIWQVLIQSSTKERIRQIASGTSGSMKNISKPGLLGIRVKKVDLAAQEQFAAFVAQTDKSKLAVQQGLKELEILKKSLMQQYFG